MNLEILHYARMPWPTPWEDFFGREAPLLVDIGFGGGHSLVDSAQKRPDCNVLGMEISLPALRRGVKKIKVAGLKNALVLQGDSRTILRMLVEPSAISGTIINFPDPWPKAAHEQRRLINNEFLHLLATRMKQGAFLEIATDHLEYAAVISENLQKTPYFDSIFDTPFVIEDIERIQTKYEQIALEEGRTCHYFKWIRNANPAKNIFPVLEEYALPHVVLESPVAIEEISQKFQPFYAEYQGIHISYMEIFRSTHESKLLVEVFINEEPFQQRMGLAIRCRKTGDLVVSLHEIGFPRPTKGVHTAVYYLVEWLRELHPDTRVINSTLNVEAIPPGSNGRSVKLDL